MVSLSITHLDLISESLRIRHLSSLSGFEAFVGLIFNRTFCTMMAVRPQNLTIIQRGALLMISRRLNGVVWGSSAVKKIFRVSWDGFGCRARVIFSDSLLAQYSYGIDWSTTDLEAQKVLA